jgi:thiamine-phosphate diphosphorylase
MLVGVSVKSAQEAIAAAADGADYVGAGAVFPTVTKSSAAIGLGLLKEIVEASPIPVVAIGGITIDNAHDVAQTGCAGVAVVSAIFDASDVAAACQAFAASLVPDITQQS